jgi:hypothetical protein
MSRPPATTRNTDPRLQLIAPGGGARRWLFALCVVLPFAITAGALLWATQSGEPLKLAGGSLPLTVAVVLGVVTLPTVALWWFLHRRMLRHRLHLGDGRLLVESSFYSVDMALPELKLDEAAIVDLHERTGFRPGMKSNGYAVPGFRSGHFRLKNREKAFVAIVDERRALWLPSTRGFGLLLQPRQPEALLERLRELSNRHELANKPTRR